ncbi:hypothetical protein NP233_g1872 [Leucocoprinus birnbaumii]|uniref:Uncharacterized protein n=1 Tax=Leucocoprinus birnbaumii TaxID=56174 RepID=A0AAD5W042_9AGAR|nr:hypothetical protein NP233_g1872 [Leucocoprinus birnbaumii]
MTRSKPEKFAQYIAQDCFKILQATAAAVPAPGLGGAAAAALAILDLAVTARTNQEGFVSVGKKACRVMEIIIQRVGPNNPSQIASSNLEKDAKELDEEMKNIEDIVRKHSGYGCFKKFFLSKVIAEDVKECNQLLDSALKVFSLESDIELRKTLKMLFDRPLSSWGQLSPSEPTLGNDYTNTPHIDATNIGSIGHIGNNHNQGGQSTNVYGPAEAINSSSNHDESVKNVVQGSVSGGHVHAQKGNYYNYGGLSA